MDAPELIPEVRDKYTLRPFKNLQAYIDYFNNLEIAPQVKVLNRDNVTYSSVLDSAINYIKSEIGNAEWYGEPMPHSLEDGLARQTYQKMTEFNDIYTNRILPLIRDFMKDSKADLDVPSFQYNDRQLGTFDFNKASGGLVPLYKYYSFEKKEEVDGKDVETYKVNDGYKYRLKSEGSPVVLVPEIKPPYEEAIKVKAFREIYDGGNVFEVLKNNGLKIGGKNAFSSTIKKSYVLKEKKPKLKNAIRIFVMVGANCGITAEQYKWTGYLAIGIAEALSMLDYAVNIIFVQGNETQINGGGSGIRYASVNIKNFNETIDKSSILYVLSDITFFRMRGFYNIVKTAYKYGDYIDDSLQTPVSITDIKKMVYREFGQRDGMFYDKTGKNTRTSQFLYYFIGNVYSEEQVLENIRNICLHVVNENRAAVEKLKQEL